MKFYFPCKPKTLSKNDKFFDSIDRDSKWIAEVKWNGWRCEAIRDERGELTLWTRHKEIITEPLEGIRTALQDIPEATQLDGELMHRKGEELYIIFDVLVRGGQLLFKSPLGTRRLILESIMKNRENDNARLSMWTRIGKRKLFESTLDDERLEGIVLKRIDSPYPVSLIKSDEYPYWLKVRKDRP